MPKPSTPAVWAGSKTFSFQPSPSQQAQGFDYIATVRPGTGAPITDDHDWPLNGITTALKWVMDQLPNGGIQDLLTAILPKRSFSQNDFIRIPDVPGGLIIQWGYASGTGVHSTNFPIAFPNACLNVYATTQSAGISNGYVVTNKTGTTNTYGGFVSQTTTVASATVSYTWLAIGY